MSGGGRGGEWRLLVGTFLFVGAVYALSGPGRIDVSDGQFRFDVAQNLIALGRPLLTDTELTSRPGTWTHTALPASLLGVPLAWLGQRLGQGASTAMFLFVLGSALLGAATAALHLAFLRDLGVPARSAVAWTGAMAFATLVWPLATSTFDQVQHGGFLLLALWAAHRSARSGAGWAVLGGGAAGVLILYQEAYALVAPALGLAVFGQQARPDRAGWRRYLAFGLAAAGGLVLQAAYNAVRFSAAYPAERLTGVHPVWGNTLVGALGLLASPGKSIFLYSPPIALSLVGFVALRREQPWLARALLGTTLAWGLLISSLAFYGGDWAWGPRYLVPLLPAWSLAAPLARRWASRGLVGAVVGLGLVVQLLALSVDTNRFYLERGLHPMFWGYDRWYFFRVDGSPLFSRPMELAAILREGVPATAQAFRAGRDPGLVTYLTPGPSNAERKTPAAWLRRYQVFHLPRPWPLWLPRVPEASRPVDPRRAAWALAAAALAGALLVARGLAAGARDSIQNPAIPRR